MRSDGPEELAQGIVVNGGTIPTAADLRSACYDILHVVDVESNRAVKRILAGVAFTLAQQAQLQSDCEDRKNMPVC